MGYRSDVTALFYVKDKEHFPILKLWLTANFPVDVFKENIRWFDRGMVFEETNTKWYPDYDEVKAFDEAVEKYSALMNMDTASEDSPPIYAYEFVRLGENDDDIEINQEGEDCDFLLDVERRITCEV